MNKTKQMSVKQSEQQTRSNQKRTPSPQSTTTTSNGTSSKHHTKTNQHAHHKNHHKKQSPAAVASTNDVELIVRKKLITTTTTTTMTPIDSNQHMNQSCTSLKDKANNDNQNEASKMNNSMSCIDFRTSTANSDMEITTTTVSNQQKANPTSTADAVAALIEDSKRFGSDHNMILKSSGSNHTIVSIPNNELVNNHEHNKNNTSLLTLNNDSHLNNNKTKLMSTVKKEQLEYEFRLKPRLTKKDHLNENGLDGEFGNEHLNGKLNSSKSKCCRVCCCCFCCCGSQSALSTSESDESDSNDDDEASTSSEHRNPTLVSQKNKLNKTKKKKKKKKLLLDDKNNTNISKNEDQLGEPENASYTKNNSFKSRVINLFDLYCCCCCCNLFKYILTKTRKSSNLSKHDHKTHDVNHVNKNDKAAHSDCQSDAAHSDIMHSPPPVSCIRVLRPSNDLTPVRFDSHYNIIQALNSDQLNNNPIITIDVSTDPYQAVTEQDETNFNYDYQITPTY